MNDRTMKRSNPMFWLKIAVIGSLTLYALIIGAKIAVEQSIRNQLMLVGKQITGRDLEIDSVTFHPLFCDLVITGLRLKNPAGYSRMNPAAEVEKIRLKIAPWTLLNRLVHIREFQIEGIVLYPELKKIPVSVSDWTSLILNPEINLVDLNGGSAPAGGTAEQKTDKLWYLRIDDFSVTSARIQFTNIRNFGSKLPSVLGKWLPCELTLKNYRQLNLGADGRHTGEMLAKEIMDRHLDELHAWYEGKKAELSQWVEMKKRALGGIFRKKSPVPAVKANAASDVPEEMISIKKS